MSDLSIREAHIDDIPAIILLMNQLFEMETGVTVNEQNQSRGLSILIANEKSAVIVAELEDKLVGMCSIQSLISTAEGGYTGWIEDMVVDQTIRQAGIGAQVLAFAEEWGKNSGFTRIQLLCDENNISGNTFYAKHNWQPTTWKCWGKK